MDSKHEVSDDDVDVKNVAAQVSQIVVSPSELPTQIRIGDEPVSERFDSFSEPSFPMPTHGLWTTSLGRHGPLWHLHLPEWAAGRPRWRLVPTSTARIARLDEPADVNALVPDPLCGDPQRVPWGELSGFVDGVWLTQRGWERLLDACQADRSHPAYHRAWTRDDCQQMRKPLRMFFAVGLGLCVVAQLVFRVGRTLSARSTQRAHFPTTHAFPLTARATNIS